MLPQRHVHGRLPATGDRPEPVDDSHDAGPRSVANRSGGQAVVPSEQKQRVLVVDDEPVNLSVLTELLREQFSVLAVRSGKHALARCAAQPKPDLVLLDVMMPELDGYETCRRLKADPSTRDIPVIFVSSMSDETDETTGLELGALDYVAKPIRPAIVLARVRGVLARQRLRHELEEMHQRFTAMVVHDIRNPLAVIAGFAGLALEEASALGLQSIERALGRILQNAGRASALVLEMLDLSQLRAGRVQLDKRELDLSEMLADIAEEQALLAEQKHIRLEIDVEPALVAMADELKISEVVINLLGNALKFTPSLGTIELRARRIDHKRLEISVADSGCGIPPDQLVRVFAPWEQVTDRTKAIMKGYGLGLAICRMIVEAHGGQIEADNRRQGGAIFRFTLPALLPERALHG